MNKPLILYAVAAVLIIVSVTTLITLEAISQFAHRHHHIAHNIKRAPSP